jgi:hypothetical protein
VEVLDLFREDLTKSGLVGDQEDEELLTALGIGLVDHQIANNPGGTCWLALSTWWRTWPTTT